MARQLLQGELPRLRGLKNGKSLILSVDDEAGILFTRHKLLQAAGYDVLSAADGEQALHFFATYPVDLVLLDFLMPGMDGGAVAQEIKRLNRKIPIIMVSGSPLPEDVVTCADHCITKGQGPALLLEKIGQLLPPPKVPPLKRASAANGSGARRSKSADASGKVQAISRHGMSKPEAKLGDYEGIGKVGRKAQPARNSMVAKCANPQCSRQFRKLSQGRLFLLPPRDSSALTWKDERLTDYCYWLCPACAQTHTIIRRGPELIVHRRDQEMQHPSAA